MSQLLLTLEQIQDFYPNVKIDHGSPTAYFEEGGVEKRYKSYQIGWWKLEERTEGYRFDLWFEDKDKAISAFRQEFDNFVRGKARVVFRMYPSLIEQDLLDWFDGRPVKFYQVSCRMYAE